MLDFTVPAFSPLYPQNISREELHQDQPSLSFYLWLMFDDKESSQLVNFLKIQHSITALLICELSLMSGQLDTASPAQRLTRYPLGRSPAST